MSATPQDPSGRQERKPTATPRAAAPGAMVSVEMDRLPAQTTIIVGFGTMGTHQLIGRTLTDDMGNLAIEVEIPEWANRQERHYFFITYSDQRPFAVSDQFLVANAGGVFRVRGELIDAGTECAAMRGEEGELYSLAGDLGGLSPGSSVVVEATLADGPACGGGLPIEVRSIRER